MNDYFFDTYAFHEIIVKNPNYIRYLKSGIITTKLNLMELHYIFLSRYGKEAADNCFDRFSKYCIKITDDIIKKANFFRLLHKNRRFS